MKEGKDITGIFFELIQIAIGTKSAGAFEHTMDNDMWQQIYDMSVKHTLAGIVFIGVTKLPMEKRPHKQLFLQWHVLCERIKEKNKRLDKAVRNVSQKFTEAGFENTIIKGQGVAQLYPEPLYRTPGDIDIWLKGSRKDIFRYIKKYIPDCMPVYHNANFNVSNDVDIEVHFTPSWMFCYFTNRRLQKYFKEQQQLQMCNIKRTAEGVEFHAPDNNFNRVFILIHIYRHLLSEGIGLRQLLDYHMVLAQGFSREERDETMRVLKELRMDGFAAACMYVLQKVFNTKDEFMLTLPDMGEGEFVLNEIMIAGNFGKYDPRQSILEKKNIATTFFRRIKNVWRFIKYHPTEVLWAPIFKIWHFVWRNIYFRIN